MSIFLSSPKKCVGVGCFNAPIFNFLNANVREILVARKKKWAGRGGGRRARFDEKSLTIRFGTKKDLCFTIISNIHIHVYV